MAINMALKKAQMPSSSIQMVQVVRSDDYEPPANQRRIQSALPASLAGAPCAPIKQMVYFDNEDQGDNMDKILNAATQINEESVMMTPAIGASGKQEKLKRP
jgi:hypothetical protein